MLGRSGKERDIASGADRGVYQSGNHWNVDSGNFGENGNGCAGFSLVRRLVLFCPLT